MDYSKFSTDDLKAMQAGDISKVSTEALKMIQSGQPASQATPQAPLAWSDVPGQALRNALPSAGRLVSGLAQAVTHPIDTASNLLDAAAGGLRNITPEPIAKLIDSADPNNKNTDRAVNTANAVGKMYKGRYGSEEGLKNTLANDPVGALADLSTVLSGGAGLARLAGKVPGIAPAANIAETAMNAGAKYTNPINAVVPVAKVAAKAVGNTGKNVLGLTTATGPNAVAESAKAGYNGKTAFWDNLTGNANPADIIDTMKEAIQKMGQDKSAAYRADMTKVGADKTVLDFNGIDNALQDAVKITTYKGQTVNAKAAEAVQKIGDEIGVWKNLNPNEYHTPEGLDALKQKIGGIVESIPFEEKTARLAAGKIYNSVKSEITQQAPIYAKTMEDYSKASDLIKEIERTFSAGQKASADTALRKLQSVMRNNVNTNYGNRIGLAKTLEQKGNVDLMPALAGQAMNSWTGRGLFGQGANLATAGAAFSSPAILAALPFQSPKFVGATLYGGGKAAGSLRDLMDKSPVSGQQATLAALLAAQAGKQPH